MIEIQRIAEFLERLCPPRLAEEWDNTGLLVGRRSREAARVMTCLTITPASAAEAIAGRADLIVAHHPLPFRPLRRLTDESTAGRLLLDLIAAGVAVYSPHTAFDSAAEGINQRLAAGLGLEAIQPLRPHPEGQGAGRWGLFPRPIALESLAARAKSLLKIEHVHLVGEPGRPVDRVAVGCGAAGELLDLAVRLGCNAMLLGETNLHTCLEAQACSVGLVLVGHFASERLGVEWLAESLGREFPSLEVWASREERDPLMWR